MKRLTGLQKEILRLARKGLTNKAIGETLLKRDGTRRSARTITNTMKRILKAMDAKNRIVAIRHAEMCGELEKEGEWKPEEHK